MHSVLNFDKLFATGKLKTFIETKKEKINPKRRVVSKNLAKTINSIFIMEERVYFN